MSLTVIRIFLRISACIGISIGFATSLLAQDPHYFHYDTENGLPSSEVYDILQDREGFIWITTDRGVVRYDGYEFKTFTTEQGLSTNTNFSLQEDPDGRIWLSSINGAITYFENELFHTPYFSDTLQKLNKNGISRGLFPLGNQQYLLVQNKYFSGIDFNYMKTNLLQLPNSNPGLQVLPEALLIQGDKMTAQSLKPTPGFPQQDKVKIIAAKDHKALVWIKHYGCEPAYITDNQVAFFRSSRQIFRWDLRNNQLEVTPVFENIFIQAIYFDPASGDLFACTKTGLFRYPKGKINLPPKSYLTKFYLTSCTRDREGNYWLTTQNKGIIMVPDLDLGIAQTQERIGDTRVLSLLVYKNQLLAGGSDGSMVAMDANGRVQKMFQDIQEGMSSRPIENIIALGDTVWASYGFFFRYKNGHLIRQPNAFISSKFIFKTSYGSYINGAHTNFVFEELWNPGHQINILLKNRLYSILEDQYNTIWLGTSQGLYQKKEGNISPVSPVLGGKFLLTGRISDIKLTPSKKILLFATRNYGITLYDRQKFFHFGLNEGLVSDQINRLFVENDTVFWLCTNKGVNKLTIIHFQGNIFVKSIKLFNSLQGLPSNFVNDMALFNGSYCFATDKGLAIIEKSRLHYSSVPPIIGQMGIETSDSFFISLGKDIILQPGNNDLEIKYTAVSFRKPDGYAFYRYNLTGKHLDTAWHYTNLRSVRLLNMAPGNYIFTLQARNNNNIWSQPRILRFTIKPRFTETSSFWILLVLGSLALATGVFFIWYRTQKNKTELENRIQKSDLSRKEAELDALRNQMNPHFVYNSLNSIQAYIYSGDFNKANDFIVRFSSLMRNSLQYSRLEFIPLSKELEFIENYLYLEETRFPEKFHHVLHIAAEIEMENFSVPPLMLQPLLENAVKHAFKGMDSQGLIEISMTLMPNTHSIQVVISDNGIGMSHQQKPDNPGHTSLGLEIIQRRIELLKEKYPNTPVSIKLQPPNTQNLTGTSVVLVLPYENLWET